MTQRFGQLGTFAKKPVPIEVFHWVGGEDGIAALRQWVKSRWGWVVDSQPPYTFAVVQRSIMVSGVDDVYLHAGQYLLVEPSGRFFHAVDSIDDYSPIEHAELPKGLCGNRAPHEPHVVLGAAVGDFRCHAVQSERLPWSAERRIPGNGA